MTPPALPAARRSADASASLAGSASSAVDGAIRPQPVSVTVLLGMRAYYARSAGAGQTAARSACRDLIGVTTAASVQRSSFRQTGRGTRRIAVARAASDAGTQTTGSGREADLRRADATATPTCSGVVASGAGVMPAVIRPVTKP